MVDVVLRSAVIVRADMKVATLSTRPSSLFCAVQTMILVQTAFVPSVNLLSLILRQVLKLPQDRKGRLFLARYVKADFKSVSLRIVPTNTYRVISCFSRRIVALLSLLESSVALLLMIPTTMPMVKERAAVVV